MPDLTFLQNPDTRLIIELAISGYCEGRKNHRAERGWIIDNTKAYIDIETRTEVRATQPLVGH